MSLIFNTKDNKNTPPKLYPGKNKYNQLDPHKFVNQLSYYDHSSCGLIFGDKNICYSILDTNYNNYKVTRTDLSICPSCGARVEDCKCIYCGNNLK